MIDFIEYVVSELKSKRLSKTNAVALVRQFSRRLSGSAAVIHPLLHRNTSDLSEQRYCSTFTGQEHFLTDHQVKAGDSDSQKVLPGVAYLEMARAAVEHSLPERPAGAVLELRNTVWAQPVVVARKKDVSIALLAIDDEQVDYEIYSEDEGQEFVHCQGRALWNRQATAATVDLEQLGHEMTRGSLTPETVYATCARMGLVYGPSFRSITAIRLGSGQLLAELRLPSTATDDSAGFVLHPSLMDGALQAAAGLLEGADAEKPRLPFALETLRVLSPCPPEMVVWLRHAAGSRPSDRVVKLDIDLCAPDGRVCVEMRGFSWRVLSNELGVTATGRRAVGRLLATPVWQARDLQTRVAELAECHVLSLQQEAARDFSRAALACFERIRDIFQRKPQGQVLLQVVVTDDGEQGLFAGLSGLFRTAALENPQFTGQILLVSPEMSAEESAQRLEDEKRGALDPIVRYRNGVREVLRWQEIVADAEPAPIAFVEQGVYLITGGFGGLGVVFAREILEKTRDARVVLTGRAPLTSDKQAALDALSATPGRVIYRQLDLGNAEAVRQTVAAIREECGRLDGILHSAGMIADDFILKKESSAFSAVLEPKVAGTLHLDEATRDVQLDFFALFSAVAGAMGNLGQADYAAANSFMDHFAAHRNRQVAAGQRSGRTRAIDWPLWQAGGMAPDPASRNRLQQTTGMQPMHTATGLEAFHRILALPYDQVLVVEGDLAQIRRMLLAEPTVQAARPLAEVKIDSAGLAEKTQEYLRGQFSGILKVPAQRIDPRAALENYGIDSIVAMQLTNQLETVFGSLSKTLFFEYQTIRDLADYFIASHGARLAALFAPATGGPIEDAPAPALVSTTTSGTVVPSRRSRRRRTADRRAAGDDEPVAVIGLSGRYPEAIDLEAYWQNLRDGRDCITEVPKDRWDWREYFNEDRSKSGHHYSKWGGFIEGVDEFDPLFFNISPLEAEAIDPQERLFLQHAWMAIEDAGYTRAGLQMPHDGDLPGQVGVYAGVMYTEYQMFGAEALARGKRLAVPGSAASIANRVSYALNLHGPSMTLDTMCSSSLTAIHLACQDLKHGRTSLAIAGGVNVSIHPNKYLVLSEGQFISSDGHCESFGEGGGGYIPGEGVGVVVLKRLSDAKRDGDHIYAIIRGSALTHGGKTNGYSVPNPQAQTSAISRALAESGTDARHISYIEAHGTGTKLGDPIEITALNKAFRKYTPDTGYCLIGSAKSNIGHCESAAGIAGLTKVLLQMQHGQIVPSLHSAQLNPHIDFPSSPFIVNQTLRPWEPPVVDGRTLPRIAGISSFGAGGSNAHLIVEEYVPPAEEPVAAPAVAIVLSARTAPQLRQKASELLEFLRPRVSDLPLGSLAYTLQVGREAMDERLGILVSSTEELVERLQRWLAGEQGDVHRGQVKRDNDTFALFSTDAELQQAVERWIAIGKLPRLLELWVKGLDLDWSRLYGETKPRRISLPVYPFAKDRYWIDRTAEGHAPVKGAATAVLHPLLHSNTSDFSEQRYSSTFTGEELFLADHRVSAGDGSAHKVLPAVAYLEMARAAMERAFPERPAAAVLELHGTVWAQPVVVDETTGVSIVLLPGDGDEIEYEIYTGEQETHCQGRAVLRGGSAAAKLEIGQLRARMNRGRLEPGDLYEACARLGLIYGPSFRAVTGIHRGAGEVLAELRLPDAAAADAAGYVLHPSLMDGALQAAVALLEGPSALTEPRLPFALETLRAVAPCTPQMLAWVRLAPGSQAAHEAVRLDVDLCDADGNVCVQMHGFSTRALKTKETGTLAAAPFWQASELPAADRGHEYGEHHVILCELPDAGFDHSLVLPAQHESIAQRYGDHALACFERIQSILLRKPQEKVLVQIAVPDHDEQRMLAGLWALLNTAALENPQLAGQLVLVPYDVESDELRRILQDEQSRGLDPLVRYESGVRQVLRWQEIAAGESASPPIAFKDDGVYLITGGLGGLGTLFAEEILARTRNAKVVLTGRSARDAENQTGLLASERVAYRQVNLGDPDQIGELVSGIRNEWRRLDGILHCAGMLHDGFIVQKTSAQFRDVLAPKVTGTYNLDRATRDVELDFFVLFSSIAGAGGNPGQADYAAANAFMDRFAAYRNRQVAAGARHGRTRSINWPLWQAGGMSVDRETRELLRQSTGMQPMQTAAGVAAFHRALALPYDQTLVVEGDLAQIRRNLLADTTRPAAPQGGQPPDAINVAVDTGILGEQTREWLRRQLAGVLKLPSHKIDPQVALEEYGIDSILAMKLTSQLEKTFGILPKTLFFEYQTIGALAEYFLRQHAAQLVSVLAPAAQKDAEVVARTAPVPAPSKRASRRFSRARAADPASPAAPEPIAIIGLSGRYPDAFDLDAFWNNLREGKDCITEVPKERWDWREYFSEDRTKAGHHYSKWGGFIEGVDEFDPLFFNISPADAEYLDPQERLFLQHAWMAMEDAGYTRAGLQTRRDGDLPGQVGVYAGVMYNEYQLFAAEASARGRRLPLPGSTASVANRVSYVLNLHGPSVTLDTMCSSSLTAIHFACQDLALGRTVMAIAGGVNVSIHPNKYLVLSAGQFISSDGHCQSFGEGGDGYIPGEGVGVVILKRLSEARRDGDHIYGVIRGSAINHGGKTNGYTVPNPQAQATAISRALAESRTDARHISYIEAHGTGTTLGDPIEIAALGRAFQPYTQDTGYCLLGSAKSNIGHCESAAGIAGLTKVLLQLRHREIVPSLHSSTLNPHIDFASTPFVVNQELRPWDAPVIDGRTLPRIAGISSFGAGGSNAHLIVEEDPSPEQLPVAVSSAVIPLSARTPEQLRQKTRDLLAFLRPRLSTVDLAALAYTLQVGREPMEERLAFVVSSAEELAGKLEAWLAGEIEDCYQGQVKRSGDALAVFSVDADLQQTVDKWFASGKVTRLLDLWVQGLDLDWNKLHGESTPRRISLPAYPFARERHWIDVDAGTQVTTRSAAAALLHPLLHSNTSDLNEQSYRSTFTGDEFFLTDHRVTMNGVAGGKVLPGVAYLEMARAAIEQALPERPESTVAELRNVVWAQPIVVAQPRQITTALSATDDGHIDFEIYSRGAGEEVVHGQGRAVLVGEPAPASLDLEDLERQMVRGPIEPDVVYAAFARMGLSYGPAFRTITAIHRGPGQVLAHLRMPASAEPTRPDYVLHPSLMDGALQAAVGLLDDLSAPHEPRLPFELELLRVLSPCTGSMVAWVRLAPGSSTASHVVKLDIDLCDDRGNVAVQLRGLASRVLSKDVPAAVTQSQTAGSLLATPVWQTTAVETFSALEFVERHTILCELAQGEVEQLATLLPLTECLLIQADEDESIARRYSRYAAACFEQVQSIFHDKREGKVLVQMVIADDQEHSLFAGLSGLLKTAALENPQFIGQLILVPADTTAEDLERYLNREMSRGLDALVRYRNGVRRVLRWQEVAAEPEEPPVAFKDDGVYLITGGVGGLGLLFTTEILERTRDARVVLTGRSALTAERKALLEALPAQGGRVSYRELDLMDLGQVEDLIAGIREEYGRLDGILHAAGMIADGFILHKDVAELSEVLAPKVTGTVHLDHASRDVELDFFVLFSSVAGAMGNPGQADYAAANGFMDQFAAYRDGQVAANQRHGRTRSINWPLWQHGGMKLDRATEELLRQTTGMSALQTATGLQAFHRSMALPCNQMLVVEGDLARLRGALLAEPDVPPVSDKQPVAAAEVAPESLAEKTQDYLRDEFSGILKLPAHKIDAQAPLEKYGIDSILAIRLTNHLEKTFGPLSKTLFFEYQTIAALAGYFIKAHSAALRQNLGLLQQKTEAKGAHAAQSLVAQRSARRTKARFAAPAAKQAGGDIAIVGLAGRYPQAENLLEFWRNLKDGRDCITEVPADRWDHTLYFDPDPSRVGKSYTKWGGFIADVDKFDPLFFNISPKEAELLDPQERLFLETAWETIEDAGYTREKIAGGRVGVFVGVMWGQYELFGAESVLRGNPVLPGSSYASIANRVSYFFDLRGPSIALDTMCSSSMTAIHLACEALRSGEIEAAIAGGVNVSIHPYKYLSLSQGKFAATDGRCRSFGAGGDGYVPGEGVGAVLLKPLEQALRDGDQIYATIKSSSVNHGGKTNGYTVPNPNAQGELIRDALAKANIDPKTLGYIETHGTGTSLGDPIEVTGLLQAFEGSTGEKQSCPIGSVKSNIGHLEAAAGIAALTKALLQLRYEQLVPSLHADPPNPNINFADSPFYVQTELADWARPASHPRRVGVSSFGAGGANAHLILEESPAVIEPESAPLSARPETIVLSAKTPEALLRYAERVVRFLDAVPNVSLADMAYTFQVGRTAMDARLAVITSSTEKLRGTLEEWIALRKNDDASEMQGVFQGNIRETQYSAGTLIAGPAGKAFLETLLKNRDLERVARLWVLGADIDWSLLERDGSPRRVSLPTYPFAKERYWVRQETPPLRVARKAIEPVRQTIEPRRAIEQVEEKRRISYVPQWTARELASPADPRPAIGTILLLDTSEELFTAWSELPDTGTIVLVRPGDAFTEIAPNSYAFDFTREDQFQVLVTALESKGLLPDVVLHHATQPCDLERADDVARQLDLGVFALFHLCRALMGAKREALRVLSLFAGAPLGAAIAGFLKTLALEAPSYGAKTVEIAGDLPLSGKIALILDELRDAEWRAPEIRYRDRARSVRTLVPQAAAQGELPLRRNGVYLLTGGLGGLGIIFAEYLAKNYQARLILTGRTAPNAGQQAKIERLKTYGAEVLVLQADVARRGDVEMVVRAAKERFLQIHGVIHAAGVTRDAFLLRKTREEMDAVLAPKVYGTINLDLATSGESLDFFALFASVAGVTGNVGQCDYAFGNRFLDSFAESRALTRSGRTLSIDWPFWQEGGMRLPQDDITRLERQTGLVPLPTQDGLAHWEELLRSDAVQAVALYGVAPRIAAFVGRQSDPLRPGVPVPLPQGIDPSVLVGRTEAYLKAIVGEEINLAPERIGSFDPLESFGIDSVMINRINAQLASDLGELPKTLLYEHETVRELAAYLVREAREALLRLFGSTGDAGEPLHFTTVVAEEETGYEILPARESDELEAIAIIGMHGDYPHSATLEQYWENLKQGRDLIDPVPSNRWDADELYHPDPAAAADGKIYCKWGGFLEGHDQFDPHFFKISTTEAALLDPQERLFLQSVWAAIEDAGYTRDRLRASYPKAGSADVGVFVGVTTNSYHLWAPEERTRGNFVSPMSLPWSIANRVSYFFDFNGPSLPIDTACSSSLVALHLACESLRNRECQVAVAGGVNLYLHPAKYQSLCQKRMLSVGGKCHSYGAGDDGFVPGEGVGTVVLKPLSRAIADRDRIHAVIRASAFDHSGRSNGYSAPNPNAQAHLISRTLEKARIHPETIGYVEGHGTGTQLGDSIEVAALTKAFRKETTRRQFCPLGSVKANIGHSESAAGIAGLAKVVLQMQHGQLAPSIHSDEQNPNIELETSPFYLQHGLSEWQRPADHPRRALINSFGAGGLNACLLVEEYAEEYSEPQSSHESREAGPYLFALSAKSEDRLHDYADRLLAFARNDRSVDLAGLCYTLQTGREAMEERLAIVVANIDELIERLGEWSDHVAAAGVHRGSLRPRRGANRSLKLVPAAQDQSLADIASQWVAGEKIDWESLYSGEKPRRIAVPTYPFARERYWLSDGPVAERSAPSRISLHPLIAYNSSTLDEVRFSSSLPETAFCAADHKVGGEGILPGAAFLELACVAANMASEQRVRKIRDVLWMQPLSFRNGAQTLRTVLRRTAEGAEYVISSFDDDHEQVVHSEGRLAFGNSLIKAAAAEDRMTPQALKTQCSAPEPGSVYYDRFRALGLHYGPSFQTIQEIHVNHVFALSKLKIADELKREFGQFILHPSMIDGALQTIAGLVGGQSPQAAWLPFALDELEILGPVPQTCYAYAERADAPTQSHAGVAKFNIRLLNESGETLVKLRNLYVRPLAAPFAAGHSPAPSRPAAGGRLLSLSGGAIE